jgi:hypothetical protein
MPGRVGRSLMSSEPGTAARVGSSGTSRGGLLLRAGSRPTGVAQGTPGIGGRPGIRLYAVSPHLRPKPPFLRASSPSGALGYRKARPPPVSSLCRRWCPTRSPLGLATLCQCRFVSSPRVSAARPRRSQYEQRSREPNRRQCRRRRAPWRFGRRITIGSIVTRRPLRFGDPMAVPHYICRSRGSIILRQSKSSIRCTALLRHPRTTRMPSIAVYGDSGMGNSMIVGRFKHEEAFFRRRRLQEDPTEFSRRRTVRRAGRPVPLRTDPHGPRRAPQSTRDDRRPRSKPPPPASAKGDISTLLKGDISTLP